MSKPPILIVYIPGLGDGYDKYRRHSLKYWSKPGVEAIHFASRWSDQDETLHEKIDRLRSQIDGRPKGASVVLVGESAGGALSLVARSMINDISGVVTVCGMNQGENNVSPVLYRANPAFKETMRAVDQLLPATGEKDLVRTITIYSVNDFTVRPRNSRIKGVRSVKLHAPGHLLSIAYVLAMRGGLVRRLAYELVGA